METLKAYQLEFFCSKINKSEKNSQKFFLELFLYSSVMKLLSKLIQKRKTFVVLDQNVSINGSIMEVKIEKFNKRDNIFNQQIRINKNSFLKMFSINSQTNI